jgi:inositol-phosphate phosphatase/L-galactose 1-phosphate phosphatase/histidinol-phosphatase
MSALSEQDRSDYAAFMNILADNAAVIAQRYFDRSVGYQLKTDASPVTIADKEIEMEMVAAIRTRYPDHGIFGEETGRINPDAPLQWVIDPIDGTKAFIAGKPTFVTLIALCEHGAPTLGVISQPIQGKRWHSGAINASPEPVNALSDAVLATTSMSYFSAQEIMLFQQLEKNTSTILLNHDGLAAGLLVDGSVDIIIESALKPYDYAALVPVVEAAGGVITDWTGAPLTLESGGKLLAARDKSLHKQALELLQGGT